MSLPVGTVIEAHELSEVLPHRYPFLLIDRVREIVHTGNSESRIGRRARAVKNVTRNEEFFNGHFPGRPIMPGVLLIEAIAQAGIVACWRKEDPPMNVAIGSIHNSKFRRPVVPGDQLEIDVEVLKDRKSMILLRGKIKVEEQVVCEAEILAYVTPANTGRG